jgi:hypothetical protein
VIFSTFFAFFLGARLTKKEGRGIKRPCGVLTARQEGIDKMSVKGPAGLAFNRLILRSHPNNPPLQ